MPLIINNLKVSEDELSIYFVINDSFYSSNTLIYLFQSLLISEFAISYNNYEQINEQLTTIFKHVELNKEYRLTYYFKVNDRIKSTGIKNEFNFKLYKYEEIK